MNCNVQTLKDKGIYSPLNNNIFNPKKWIKSASISTLEGILHILGI